MAPQKKRDKIKGWLLRPFSPNNETLTPEGGQRQGDSFKNIQNVDVNNATYIHGDNNVVMRQDGHGDRNMVVTHVMSLLLQHTIRGAAHDSSARTPPPRCHPDTRVKLIARITAWFDGQARQELLLWLTGPAGVGKSAIGQTFAEYLAKSKLLGASVFISRPNKRNNPQGIFITIAYQLATRIEAYRSFIAERLSLDPDLLNGDIQAQFTTFIVEPFVEQKIGAGGKRWGILLDGLDELKGEDAQCGIIELISTFTHEHPDTPLVWIIASRPESHISNMFDDDEVRRSCWVEYIPIDSTEACADVERFLRSSFITTQKKFRDSVLSDWPSNTDFLKLTAAASGLFVYAEVVMQFIRDPDVADPVSQLVILLLVIDRSHGVPTKEKPFVHLDALYHAILSSIPKKLLRTAIELLGFMIYANDIPFLEPHIEPDGTVSFTRRNLQTLRGMSIFFGIPRHAVYACLNKCRSTLKIPNWKVAHEEPLRSLHASFADYLVDSSRSGDFHVGNAERVETAVVLRLLEIWNQCAGDNITTASVNSMWNQYCSKLDEAAPSKTIAKFHAALFQNALHLFQRMLHQMVSKPTKFPTYAPLRKIHMIKLWYCFDVYQLYGFVFYLTKVLSNFTDTGLFRQVQLGDLKFDHLDWKEMSPAYAHYGRSGKISKEMVWILHRPHSNAELKALVSELESLRERLPEIRVVIIGGVPKGRIAAFRRPLKKESVDVKDFVYYGIPYPE